MRFTVHLDLMCTLELGEIVGPDDIGPSIFVLYGCGEWKHEAC